MQSHQHHETKVQAVCRLAKADDKAAIRALIKSGVCIGLYENSYNAVMLLAKEGHVDAVWFLINAFGASVNHAVRGAAWGGHESLVWRLIEEGANKEHALEGAGLAGNLTLAMQLITSDRDAWYAMRGAAESKNEDWQELVNKLMVYARYKEHEKTDRSNVVKYVEQLPALKQQLEKINKSMSRKWVKLQELVTPDTIIDIGDATQAAMQLGYGELAKAFIKIYIEINGENSIIYRALEGAVQGGHDKLVIDLVRGGASSKSAARLAAKFNNMKLVGDLKKLTGEPLIYSTMAGAAYAGDFERVKSVFNTYGRQAYMDDAKKLNQYYVQTNQLFMNFANKNELNFILMGAARGGKIEFTKQLIAAGAEEDSAYLGAAMGRQTQLVNWLCESGLIPNEYKAYAAARCGDTDYISRLMEVDVDMYLLVTGAVEGEQIELINQFVTRGQVDGVIKSLKNENYLINEAYTLRLLCFINDDQVRYRFAEAFYIISPDHLNSEVETCAYLLFHKANRLRFLMQQHDLDFNQAQAWLTPQLTTLFLQVFPTLQLKKQLPLEMLLSIASFVTNTADVATSVRTYNNTLTLFNKHQAVVLKRLLDSGTYGQAEASFNKTMSF